MQNVNELIPKIGQSQPIADVTRQTFDQATVDATQYFFAKIRSVYGVAKYEKSFPNDVDEKVSKREWASRIGKFSKQDINKAFEHAKDMLERNEEQWQWPNIGLILSAAKDLKTKKQPFRGALPEPAEARENRLAYGLEQLKKIRSQMMGVKTCA
jgi:hypothetical protein